MIGGVLGRFGEEILGFKGADWEGTGWGMFCGVMLVGSLLAC